MNKFIYKKNTKKIQMKKRERERERERENEIGHLKEQLNQL